MHYPQMSITSTLKSSLWSDTTDSHVSVIYIFFLVLMLVICDATKIYTHFYFVALENRYRFTARTYMHSQPTSPKMRHGHISREGIVEHPIELDYLGF